MEARAFQSRGLPVCSALEPVGLYLWARGYVSWLHQGVTTPSVHVSDQSPQGPSTFKAVGSKFLPVYQLQGTVKGALGKHIALGSTLSGSDSILYELDL